MQAVRWPIIEQQACLEPCPGEQGLAQASNGRLLSRKESARAKLRMGEGFFMARAAY